jgi:predicted transcriptional regulator
MDLSNPLRAVAPGVEGDVLAVLLRTHAPLTGARVAALAERSETQVREVLRRQEQHGLVDVERHGQSYSYALNREHVLVPGLELLHSAMPTIEDRLRQLVADWVVAPTALLMFGSAARRDGDSDSDVDLLLVRPDDRDADDEAWSMQRHELARRVERWTGNAAQIVEFSTAELAKAVMREEPLIAQLRDDGILLAGREPKLGK